MDIETFYRENPPSLEPITPPRWRQFRFMLEDGRFFKVPDTIRDAATLQKWLVLKKPIDVYYTVGRFLSPERLGRRTDVVSENLFLGADLVFDLDRTPFSLENIEKVRKDALRLSSWLKEAGIRIRYRAFSGSKGFHLVCEDPFDYPDASPLKREKLAKDRRKVIAERVLEEGIPIDSKVTVDTRRILRLPGTVNSKTGRECIVLTDEELARCTAERILNKSRLVDVPSSRIRKEMTDTLQVLRKNRGLHRGEVRSSPTPFYASFLSSEVAKTPLHVPLIVFRETGRQEVEEKITRLQQAYRLSDFFLFQSEDFFGFSLDALAKRRVEKILNAADAKNRHFFQKYNKAYARIGPKVGPSMESVGESPVFTKVYPAPTPAIHPHSKGHARFLLECSIPFETGIKFAGEEVFALSHCLVEP